MKRVNYAVIKLCKNYSKLQDKESLIDKDGNVFHSTNTRYFVVSPKRKNKTTKFFHNNTHEYYSMQKASYKNHDTFITQKERHIKNHYNNPFAEIVLHTYERKIIKKENKITIKLYIHTKGRNYNDLYFKKFSQILSLSIDINTGDIIFCDIHYSGKSKKGLHKKIRKNSFLQLFEFIKQKNLFKINTIKFDTSEDNFYKFRDEIYEQEEFYKILNNTLGLQVDDNNESIFFNLINKFIDIKKIKLPNNYDWRYICSFYPGAKFLKKNNNNLYAAILDLLKIKCKSTIKYLNKYPNIDIFSFSLISRLFGDHIGHNIKNINLDKFHKISEFGEDKYTTYNKQSFISILERYGDLYLSDKDMKCLTEYINNLDKKIDLNVVVQIYDHFNMINKLRKFNINIHMSARNDDEFFTEHIDLTGKLSEIEKEYYSEKIFDKEFVNDIEIDCNYQVDDINFESRFFLLKSELDYENEAKCMHHCVSSYFDNNNSIIISIREKNSKDRVTCEIEIKTGNILQARTFCNQEPPPKFIKSVDFLKKLLHAQAKKKKLAPIKIETIKNDKYIEQTPTLDSIF